MKLKDKAIKEGLRSKIEKNGVSNSLAEMFSDIEIWQLASGDTDSVLEGHRRCFKDRELDLICFLLHKFR